MKRTNSTNNLDRKPTPKRKSLPNLPVNMRQEIGNAEEIVKWGENKSTEELYDILCTPRAATAEAIPVAEAIPDLREMLNAGSYADAMPAAVTKEFIKLRGLTKEELVQRLGEAIPAPQSIVADTKGRDFKIFLKKIHIKCLPRFKAIYFDLNKDSRTKSREINDLIKNTVQEYLQKNDIRFLEKEDKKEMNLSKISYLITKIFIGAMAHKQEKMKQSKA